MGTFKKGMKGSLQGQRGPRDSPGSSQGSLSIRLRTEGDGDVWSLEQPATEALFTDIRTGEGKVSRRETCSLDSLGWTGAALREESLRSCGRGAGAAWPGPRRGSEPLLPSPVRRQAGSPGNSARGGWKARSAAAGMRLVLTRGWHCHHIPKTQRQALGLLRFPSTW